MVIGGGVKLKCTSWVQKLKSSEWSRSLLDVSGILDVLLQDVAVLCQHYVRQFQAFPEFSRVC